MSAATGGESEMSIEGPVCDPMKALKILLVGHAFWPGEGSEPGITWNWAWHLSEYHEVWVLAPPLRKAAVEAALAGRIGRAPRVVWVDVPRDPERGERGIRLHYLRWQRAAFAQAQHLHATQNFDIVHHLSWATVNSAPKLWRLDTAFVWGPLGGGQAAPLRFARHLGWRGALGEAGRHVRRRLLPFLPPLRGAAANSALILATNPETAEILYRAGAARVELFYDNGVLPEQLMPRRKSRQPGACLELIWAGRLEVPKALPLALEAMARVTDLPVRLSIAGQGPLRATCERRAAALGLGDRVRFLGFVPRERLLNDVFAHSDAFLFTSLQDSAASVVLEAMAASLPVIGLDHQGVGMMVPEHAAIKVPVTSPSATVQGLADGIRALAASPELGLRLGEAARRHAATETWSRRAVRMNALYRSCLETRAGRARLGPRHSDPAALSESAA
ncbi:MAG TPA: glycosyltransferase family 4 protein [Woeseiaceae bacterium]|nr:glycosyltransferase family 4 protein [Woeseiaceae bacterium]